MSKFKYPDKLDLALKPTPIQFLAHLSEKASKYRPVKIYAKRDDINHGPAAGNKIRKLEFLFADAKAKNAKVILTCGAIQSNHARATAILARELGMESVLFLRGERPESLEGNFLLDQLVGARVIFVDAEQYANMPSLFRAMIESYRAEKISAYAIPEGGSNDLGVFGYANAVEEIAQQCGTAGLPNTFDSIVCATGSGGTYAGLVLGRNLLGWDQGQTNCVTFNVCHDAEVFKNRVIHLLVSAIQRAHLPVSFMSEDIRIVDGYVGPGYAKTTPELMSFITEVSHSDGILLDPVYTGKAMFGLISELTASPERAAAFGDNILFIHTGGLPSLFAYQKEMERAILQTQ